MTGADIAHVWPPPYRSRSVCWRFQDFSFINSFSSSSCRLQPGNYQRTVKRTEDAFQACNDIVACFQERARVERLYAQQLSEWSNKWKPVVDSSKRHGRL